MARIFHIMGDEEVGYNERGYSQRDGHDEERMLEKAFKEGCEHGYKKAMREIEELDERGGRMSHRTNFREGFEEKIERLKKKYE